MNFKICSNCHATERMLFFVRSKTEISDHTNMTIGYICQRCKTIRLVDEYRNYKII